MRATRRRACCAALLLIPSALGCGRGGPPDRPVSAASVGRIGSFEEPLVGSPPFPNLICCTDVSQCSDGDAVYAGCRMPDSVVPNSKLCGFAPGEEEFPFICDYCPGATQDECDGTGWVAVGEGQFQCDGPVYRGSVGGLRQIAEDTWHIPAGADPVACNNSYDLCASAACFEQDCISCASIDTSSGQGMCPGEPGAQCHSGQLEGSTALLCCSPINLACVRPNAITGDCSGSPAYDATFTTLASCAACPTPDDPSNEEACHGWDLGDDIWFPPAEELGSSNSLSCSSEDEAGCKLALYACDGVLTTAVGVELENACTQPACDGI